MLRDMATWLVRDCDPGSDPTNTATLTLPTAENGRDQETRRGTELWWERDKLVIAWLRKHPSTIQQIANRFFNGSYKPAHHCIKRLWRKKKIRRQKVSIQLSPAGRPTDLYFSWHVSKPVHEYLVTEFCVLFSKAEFKRGAKVGERRPDAEMYLGRKFDIEVHTCSQTQNQVKARWKSYEHSNDPLLVVVHDPEIPEKTVERLNELVSWGKSVESIALYIPLTELKKDAFNAVWIDGTREETTLRKILGTNQR